MASRSVTSAEWDTGLRARFFFIIFSVLTIVALGATSLHGLVLKEERLALIDQQVRDAATALLDSELNGRPVTDNDRVEEILSDELGETRIGKFFVLRNAEGHVLYESGSVRLLPVREIPRRPQWVTLRAKGRFIRVLNLELPRVPDRALQVGIVVDESLVDPNYLSTSNLSFAAFILLLGLLAAAVLTSTLLRPLSLLVEYIAGISPEARAGLPSLPPALRRIADRALPRDELRRLLESFSALWAKIDRTQKLSRVWSYQMAHELKTPLAVMEAEIARGKGAAEISGPAAEALRHELWEASETVSAFLTWAELEGAGSDPSADRHAISVHKTAALVAERLSKTEPGRVELRIDEDFRVFASPPHFEHMLLNLVSNALNHSAPGSKVVVHTEAAGKLVITDEGPGIPERVLSRWGEPFNKGESGRRGHGLGLAYVQSVAKLYGWSVEPKSSPRGTEIHLNLSPPST